MKTAVYFIITLIISAGALLGALNMKNPFPLFAVAFAIWGLFLWAYNRRSKKEAQKRSQEQLFENYMRANLRNRNR